jgi:hypothetical protein
MKQISRNLTASPGGFLNGTRHLIIDRDTQFCSVLSFEKCLKTKASTAQRIPSMRTPTDLPLGIPGTRPNFVRRQCWILLGHLAATVVSAENQPFRATHADDTDQICLGTRTQRCAGDSLIARNRNPNRDECVRCDYQGRTVRKE